MNFKVNSTEMKVAVTTASKAIIAKNVLPILSCVKITSDSADSIVVTGSSQEVRLSVACPAHDIADFRPICVEAALLNSALGNLSHQELEFNVSGNNLTIVYQGGHFNLTIQEATEYPELDLTAEGVTTRIPSEILSEAMRLCRPFIAHDDLRPVMNGVYLDFTGDVLTFAATDGHKLVRKSYPEIQRGEQLPASAIVSEHTAALLALLPKAEEVAVTITERQTQYSAKGYSLVAASIEGRYPNYNSVIPTNYTQHIDVERAALINALKRVGLMGNKSTGLIRLEADSDMMGGRLAVSSEDLAFFTSANESLQVDHNIEGRFAIGFKGDFLASLLATHTSPTVRIEVGDHSRAAILHDKGESENNLLTLLMPMMLS